MLLFAMLFWFIAIGQLKQHVFSYKRKRASTLAFIITVAYGGAIELIQGNLLSGRTMDILDMIANIIGATIGWFFFLAFKKKYKKEAQAK